MVRTKPIKGATVFLLLFIGSLLTAKGVEEPVRITQVCLNKQDSTAGIKWQTSADLCASFQEYRIYGRDENFSPYEFLEAITDFNQSFVSVKLPNVKEWEFFIVTRYACNGTDTLVSDTVKADLEQPIEWELDSVSVDLITQKAILGWSTHPAEDSEGYFVYYSGTNNILLTDTFGLFFRDETQGNPANQAERYALATYDSCGNTSPISGGHTTLFLQGNLDTCGREINLQWSEYQPLTVEKYYIRLSSDSFSNFLSVDSVLPSTQIYSFPNLETGQRYCFVIQMLSDAGITSTSNRMCFETPVPSGAANHIHKVTVTEAQQVEISFRSELPEGTISLIKASENGFFNVFREFEATEFAGETTLLDTFADVNKAVYYYQITHKDVCDYAIPQDSSAVSNTVLLEVNETDIEAEISWNLYNTFAEGVGEYHLHKQYGLEIFPRSTWNLTDVLNPNQNMAFDVYQNQEYAYKLCYVVKAIEKDENAFGRQDTSFSNSVCFIRELAIYFPNAFAPKGINTVFKPIGIGIDERSNESVLEIYNRWGEKIFETNKITEGWDGTNFSGSLCQSGTYVYIAKVKGELGETVEFKGTVYLLD